MAGFSAFINVKIHKSGIHADVAAKARIQWIQGVRSATAELLSVYYEILFDPKDGEIQKMYAKSREKNALLILFFGPDRPGRGQTEDIKDIRTNRGKNHLIVELLNRISDMVFQYIMIPVCEENANLGCVRRDTDPGEKKNLKADIENALCELNAAIRIYGKIEWDKAKRGK